MPLTFAIGDIHGALKALEELIEKLDLQPADQLFFLGDYVDGWPQSAPVIDYLISLSNLYTCIFLKGNHDLWCEDWLKGKKPDDTWLQHGGAATVESYRSLTKKQKKRHLDFFKKMRDYYIDSANRLFVHAGFSSMHGPGKERYQSNYAWDRTLWEMALATDARIPKDSNLYPKRLLLFSEIYIGHTPTTNYGVATPMQACNVWNIDTGAAFNGKVSAINIATKEYVQSGTVQLFYPGEKGRNK